MMRNPLDHHDQAPRYRRGLSTIGAMAFVVPLCAVCLWGVRIQSNGGDWLAEHDPTRRLLEWHQQQSLPSNTIIATWEGSTVDDPRLGRLVIALTGQIDADGVHRGGVPQVAAVTSPRDLFEQMVSRGIDPADVVRRLTGSYLGVGGLKLVLTEAGRSATPATTQRLIARARDELGLELAARTPFEPWSAEDHSAAEPDEADTPLLVLPEYDLEITWRGFHPESAQVALVRSLALALSDFPTAAEPHGRRLIRDCFLAPGTPVAIAIRLSESGIADVDGAVDAVRRAAKESGIPAEQFHLGGHVLVQAEMDRAAQRMVWDAGAPGWRLSRRSVLLLSLLVGGVLAIIVARSVRIGAMVYAWGLFGALLLAALMGLLGSAPQPLLATMLLSVFALGLAAAFHVASALRPGKDTAGANDTSRSACKIAGFAVLLAIAPLALSSTPPLRLMGRYGLIGGSVALALCLYGLPAVLSLAGAGRNRVGGSGWLTLGSVVIRRPLLLSAVSCLLLAGGMSGLMRLGVETRTVQHLSRGGTVLRDAAFIEDNLTGPAPLDVIVRFSSDVQNKLRFIERLEIVRAAEQAVRRHPAVSGTLSLADFLPEQTVPPPDAPTRQRVLFNRHSNAVEEQIRSGAVAESPSLLCVARDSVDWQMDGDQRLSRNGDELWRISANARLLADINGQRLRQELDGAVQSVLRIHPGVDHVVAGPAVFSDAAQRTLLVSLAKRMILVCVALAGVLIWLLRSPVGALPGLLVNVLPIGCVLGMAAWCGLRIDAAALVAALVAVCVGAYGSVHLLVWFRECLRQERSRHRAVLMALALCGRPLWQTGCVLAGMLLALLGAELGVVSRFGGLLGAMIVTQLLAETVLLPALLAGPLGALLERSLAPAAAAGGSRGAETSSPHLRFETAAREAVRPAV